MSAATRRQKAPNFHSSAALDPVFPLRSKAPHNGKTAVSQKKNRASLFWALVLTGATSQRADRWGTRETVIQKATDANATPSKPASAIDLSHGTIQRSTATRPS
jgi:hypothetical protein